MHVAQLFDPLLLCPHVEVVVARLPKVFAVADQPPRHRLFQRLQCSRQRASLWFADQQMHVFRHDDVTTDVKSVPESSSFQGAFE